MENWGVYSVWNHCGQRSLIKDGFLCENDANEYESTIEVDKPDESTLVMKI